MEKHFYGLFGFFFFLIKHLFHSSRAVNSDFHHWNLPIICIERRGKYNDTITSGEFKICLWIGICCYVLPFAYPK